MTETIPAGLDHWQDASQIFPYVFNTQWKGWLLECAITVGGLSLLPYIFGTVG
jgi:hypothetical protein